MKYTVVLRRREDLARMMCPDDTRVEIEANVYVAIGVEADSPMLAVYKAKVEVKAADRRDLRREGNLRSDTSPVLTDYICLAVFEGELRPALYGNVTGGQGR